MNQDQAIMTNISRLMYTLLRGTSYGKGWHDKADYHFSTDQYKKYSKTFFQTLEENDMDLTAYCVLACTLARAENFKSPMSLYGRKNVVKWMIGLRQYCGSSESFSELANLIYGLLDYQSNLIVDHNKMVYFTFSNLVKDVELFVGESEEVKNKYLQTYFTLVDRIEELKAKQVDPRLWIIAKYEKCIKAFDDNIAFSAIANQNSLEPDLSKLKLETQDEWRELRHFLGVSPSCEFVDGSIPKGWRPASGDRSKIEDICKISKDGYYVYSDGSQRQGKRHYMGNSYFVINCTPENFAEFKKDWDDVRLLSKNPTWEEYEKWGPEEKWWDKNGTSLTGRGRNVKWRKN